MEHKPLVEDFFGYQSFPNEVRQVTGKVQKELVSTHLPDYQVFIMQTINKEDEPHWVTIFVKNPTTDISVGDRIYCEGSVFLHESLQISDEANFSKDVFMLPLGGMKVTMITKENN